MRHLSNCTQLRMICNCNCTCGVQTFVSFYKLKPNVCGDRLGVEFSYWYNMKISIKEVWLSFIVTLTIWALVLWNDQLPTSVYQFRMTTFSVLPINFRTSKLGCFLVQRKPLNVIKINPIIWLMWSQWPSPK